LQVDGLFHVAGGDRLLIDGALTSAHTRAIALMAITTSACSRRLGTKDFDSRAAAIPYGAAPRNERRGGPRRQPAAAAAREDPRRLRCRPICKTPSLLGGTRPYLPVPLKWVR
jgi:hypothetical protein